MLAGRRGGRGCGGGFLEVREVGWGAGEGGRAGEEGAGEGGGVGGEHVAGGGELAVDLFEMWGVSHR